MHELALRPLFVNSPDTIYDITPFAIFSFGLRFGRYLGRLRHTPAGATPTCTSPCGACARTRTGSSTTAGPCTRRR